MFLPPGSRPPTPARVTESVRRMAERIETGEIPLITDERWLPTAFGDVADERYAFERRAAHYGYRLVPRERSAQRGTNR
jgi:hypothetical protein